MGMIKFPSSCSSPKALCNQFIDYYICSRGVFCINHIKLRNFVVITIECSIATVDRGSIMTRLYRWSMMVMLSSSSNRKYPPFPLFSYFSVAVCLRCLLHNILPRIVYTFRENRGFVFISIVQFMISANSRIRFCLQIVFVCLNITPYHYQHCANFI